MENLIRLSNLKSRANLLYRFGVRRFHYGKISDVEKWLCNGRYAAQFSNQEFVRDIRSENLWLFKNSKRFLQPTPYGGSFVPYSLCTASSRTYCTSSENQDNENKDNDNKDNGGSRHFKQNRLQNMKKMKEYLVLVKYKTIQNGGPREKFVMNYNYNYFYAILSNYEKKVEQGVKEWEPEVVAYEVLKEEIEREFDMELEDIPNDLFEKKRKDKNADYRLPNLYTMPYISFWLLMIALTVVPTYMMLTLKDEIQGSRSLSSNVPVMGYITMQEFFDHLLSTGQVDRIQMGQEKSRSSMANTNVATVYLHPEAVVKGKTIYNGVFRVSMSDKIDFEQAVRDKEKELGIRMHDGVEIAYSKREQSIPPGSLFTIAVWAVVIIALLSNRKKISASTFNSRNMRFDKMAEGIHKRSDQDFVGKKKVTFKDVAGLNEAKVEIMEFVDFLKNPEKYKKLGGKMPRGALLLGPPGCGKTLLAKAVSCEAGVPFYNIGGSQFVEIIGGLGARRMRQLFKDAKKNTPCVIFIDEIDALGGKRAKDHTSGESEQTLNQLLTELDGMGTDKDIICLAATNRAEKLDKALLRPGRFSRHIDIGLPAQKDREDIFLVHLKNLKNLEDDINELAVRLSKLTHGMSGADIANMCNEAALHAARGKQDVITRKNFEYASERIALGAEKRKNTISKEEKHVIAYHESGHALVSWLLKSTNDLLKVSIVERTGNSLGVTQFQTNENYLRTNEEIFEEMCVALGGRAAEMLIFKRLTSGAVQDLEHVTQLAYSMVQMFGMNEEVGLVSFPGIGDRWKDNYSQSLKEKIEHEVQKLVAEAYETTQKLLQENEDKLHTLATELMKKETVNRNELVDLIGPPVTNQEPVTTSQ